VPFQAGDGFEILVAPELGDCSTTGARSFVITYTKIQGPDQFFYDSGAATGQLAVRNGAPLPSIGSFSISLEGE
jgi:hypothetical protein